MSPETFIESIKQVVVNNSVDSIESNLLSPPGRQPHVKLVLMSNWLNHLEPKDREMVRQIITESVEMAVFGFLCVIDGVSAIEDNSSRGSLELYYTKDGQKKILNDPDGEYLHDLFNAK